MNVHQLAELAGLVSTNAPSLIKRRTLVGESTALQYWTASRCRIDRWSSSLQKLVGQLNRGPSPMSTRELRATCNEILASEILTRVWTAVARLYDQHAEIEYLSPISKSIYRGHLEARNTVLHLITDGPGLSADDALALNTLRRRCERWTDMLVGFLSSLGDVEDLVFDAERMRDFAEDLSYGNRMSGGPAAWALLSVSLKTIFDQDMPTTSLCAELNQQIGSAIMGSFPVETFDGTGVASDQWLSRLTRTTDDAHSMIDAFLRDAYAPIA